MDTIDISIIIPMKNLENKISSIIMAVSSELCDLKAELIVIDMGSSDSCMLEALATIQSLNLRGSIVQNGECTLSQALNVGIYKSSGKYINFLFPNRMYYGYIPEYKKMADLCEYDLIFSCMFEDEEKNQNNLIKSTNGQEVLISYLKDSMKIDIAAIFVKNKFLLDNKIRFYRDIDYENMESFLMEILLKTNNIGISDFELRRHFKYEVSQNLNNDEGYCRNCIGDVEALLRFYELSKYFICSNVYLSSLLIYQKIPESIMNLVETMLNKGFSCRTVKNMLKIHEYDKLLVYNKVTSERLKSNILRWKIAPFLYPSK